LPRNTGLNEKNVKALITSGYYIFAGTDGKGIFLSTDYGDNWTASNSGVTSYGEIIESFILIGNYIFAGTADGIFQSTDNGETWIKKNMGLTTNAVYSFSICGDNIFAGTEGGGVFRADLRQFIVPTISEIPDITIDENTKSNVNFTITDYKIDSLNITLSSSNSNLIPVENMILSGSGTYRILSLTPNKNEFGESIIRIILSNGYTTTAAVFKLIVKEIVSVEDNVLNSKNLIYPNPASDFLNINSTNLIGQYISIYDMLGNKLITTIAESTETRLNIESLPTGVYIVRIGEVTKMFVK
jgi:hypothetical protein